MHCQEGEWANFQDRVAWQGKGWGWGRNVFSKVWVLEILSLLSLHHVSLVSRHLRTGTHPLPLCVLCGSPLIYPSVCEPGWEVPDVWECVSLSSWSLRFCVLLRVWGVCVCTCTYMLMHACMCMCPRWKVSWLICLYIPVCEPSEVFVMCRLVGLWYFMDISQKDFTHSHAHACMHTMRYGWLV